ncbi:alpha-E domain-containing protein [Zeaxanthinibacter sp. PT1]|uniref:alpha-E domain-containing protein n=1 Tax=Zeaxanthinibacter TaxID=561554 RepID=UPI00234B1F21|nr:alpha-E domain-containing protein [Zeaxanthinibacter sp. PT1]MDC6351657.1 alpha-E domain-containing protein [Zeaxanthinibacter sp. PT1]
MLARVANNLYWMGRYIERSEHVARYMHVNYFSSLDAPNELSQDRQFVLRSMKFMVGDPANDPDEILDEIEVLHDLGLNSEKGFSIINNVKSTRENANSARDLISTELYEAINKFYHFVLNYDQDLYVKRGLYDFCVNITEMTTILRGKIRATLLHDEVYAIIMMGMNLERATQIIRIINAKYNDALLARNGYDQDVGKSFEWITLLKCAESYDMMRRFYKKSPSSLSTLEFLILNGSCPRSVMNSLDQVSKHIHVLEKSKNPSKDSAAFFIEKVRAELKFKHIEEIEGNIRDFIETKLNDLVLIADKLEKEFFNY